ncbi:transglutaminase family protein [Acinetobacter sp. 194]|uniref:transglutaminase family protein n=1 Tax=Acinetobacter shaoyimingii TaxID=2715164 RepID=UPI001407D33E|nr:transglutaminase family protein [Acinetobacter shaoyimingii]NHB57129.1 transglutaminase family protein [Acinetobacter shaoyimingii]
MKLMINHQTHYQYTETAKNSIQYIRMTPQSNTHQQVLSWGISIPGEQSSRLDAFQNIWVTATQRYAYQNLSIMAQGIVDINVDSQVAIDTEMSPVFFLQKTQNTLCNPEMIDFVHQHVPYVSHDNLIRLSEALLAHMPYISDTTGVNTTAIHAFEERQGVCQDHTHVFLAMCKVLGVPARYVSGYLYVPDTSHLASHAWAEIYLDQNWYTFDVSNQLYTPGSHIYVAIGRDYWDVAPVRGVRDKGGIESMSSIVQVLPC